MGGSHLDRGVTLSTFLTQISSLAISHVCYVCCPACVLCVTQAATNILAQHTDGGTMQQLESELEQTSADVHQCMDTVQQVVAAVRSSNVRRFSQLDTQGWQPPTHETWAHAERLSEASD